MEYCMCISYFQLYRSNASPHVQKKAQQDLKYPKTKKTQMESNKTEG